MNAAGGASSTAPSSSMPDQSLVLEEPERELRWFLYPAEAQNILRNPEQASVSTARLCWRLAIHLC